MEAQTSPIHPPGTVSVLRIVTRLQNVIEIGYTEEVNMIVTAQNIKLVGYFCSGPQGIFVPIESIEAIFVYKPGEKPLDMPPLRKEKMN